MGMQMTERDIFSPCFLMMFLTDQQRKIYLLRMDKVIGTVQSSQKQMSKLKEDKKMSSGVSDFHYSKAIISCKWYNNMT